jgi:glycogen phosphorylase
MSSEFRSLLDKSVTGLKALILNTLKFRLARDTSTASKRDWWRATSKAVQSIVVERMIATATVDHDKNAKRGPRHRRDRAPLAPYR